MKQKEMISILAAEAAACVAFNLLHVNASIVFSSLAAFPFEQTGYALRVLSLSGAIGNAAAILLYVGLSLLPCLAWLTLKKKEKLLSIDHALYGLSILLFIVNYYMINPGLFPTPVPGTGKWMLGCMFYSALSGYLVIRVLSVCRRAQPETLHSVLQKLLIFLNMVFVYLIFGQSLGNLLKAVQNVGSMDSGPVMSGFVSGAQSPGMTYLFLGLGYLVDLLPYVFDMGIVFLAGQMLTALKMDRYGDASVELTSRLAGFCTKALGITAAADAGFNLLQVLFCSGLSQIDLVIHVPVISIIFVLAALLFARYLQEDQKLKREHDLII